MNARKLGALGRNVWQGAVVVAVMLTGTGGCVIPNDPQRPDQFDCFCGCGLDIDGNPAPDLESSVCGFTVDDARLACSNYCSNGDTGCTFGSAVQGPTWIDSAACTAPAPPPGNPGLRISGDVPNSNDGIFTHGDSIATVTYTNGAPIEMHVAGEVAFTGGCESGTCPIVFNWVYLVPDNFSIPTPLGTFDVTDAFISNYGDQIGTQSGRGFTIPSAQVQMVAHGYVNGIRKSVLFVPTPGEDLWGIHVPSTGEFGLFGHFTQLDGDLTLTLNLNGTMTARPPVAGAGALQTVSCNPATGTGTALLDGSASSDIDGDLKTVAWYEGDTLLGTGLSLGTEFNSGTHIVTGVAWDSTHKFDSADTTVTVLHDTPPVFDALSSITIPSCTPGLVILSTPDVTDLCSAVAPVVMGEIIEINGATLTTPIPVDTITGAIALPSGTATVLWTATTDGGIATMEQTIVISVSADISCCAPSQVLYEGSFGADTKLEPNATTGYCMFGHDAGDRLHSGAFADFVSGGPGDDQLVSHGGDDVIVGDTGDDDITYQGTGTIVISGGDGNDKVHLAFGPTATIFAGRGDDQVNCDGGEDTIYPGAGEDRIFAGGGNDTVIFFHPCELASKKLVVGGAGFDTLIIPAELSNFAGITAVGFEQVVVDSSLQHLAECP